MPLPSRTALANVSMRPPPPSITARAADPRSPRPASAPTAPRAPSQHGSSLARTSTGRSARHHAPPAIVFALHARASLAGRGPARARSPDVPSGGTVHPAPPACADASRELLRVAASLLEASIGSHQRAPPRGRQLALPPATGPSTPLGDHRRACARQRPTVCHLRTAVHQRAGGGVERLHLAPTLAGRELVEAHPCGTSLACACAGPRVRSAQCLSHS